MSAPASAPSPTSPSLTARTPPPPPSAAPPPLPQDLKLADKDEVEKKKDKELKDEFKDLTRWWKKVAADSNLMGVKVGGPAHGCARWRWRQHVV